MIFCHFAQIWTYNERVKFYFKNLSRWRKYCQKTLETKFFWLTLYVYFQEKTLTLLTDFNISQIEWRATRLPSEILRRPLVIHNFATYLLTVCTCDRSFCRRCRDTRSLRDSSFSAPRWTTRHVMMEWVTRHPWDRSPDRLPVFHEPAMYWSPHSFSNRWEPLASRVLENIQVSVRDIKIYCGSTPNSAVVIP